MTRGKKTGGGCRGRGRGKGKAKKEEPVPGNTDSENAESKSDHSRPPTPPPSSENKQPPEKSKKADRRSGKLTEAQQDIMFEWLEQTPAIYDINHADYKRRSQLFGEQAVRMGEGLDGSILEIWFKSCRTVISKLKNTKSGTNWTPLTHGTPNEKRLWAKMPWLVPYIKPPRRHNLKSFKRGRDEPVESDEPGENAESDMEDAMSQDSQLSQNVSSGPSNVVKSGKVKSKLKVKDYEASDPSVQLVADSNKFQSRILDIVQNMRPTMDIQRQGLMDYTAGVIQKLNDEEWGDFEDQVFPIVRQFAARVHQREKAKRAMTPQEELELALQVSRHDPRSAAMQSEMQPGTSGLQMSSAQGSFGGVSSERWQPMPGPQGWSGPTFPNVTPWQSQDSSWVVQYQKQQPFQSPPHQVIQSSPQEQQQQLGLQSPQLFQATQPQHQQQLHGLSQALRASSSVLNTPGCIVSESPIPPVTEENND